MATRNPTAVQLRRATSADAGACARIMDDAFHGIAERHNFPSVTTDRAAAFMQYLVAHPKIFGVVAEAEQQVLGFAFLRKFNIIQGIGPVCVDPGAQAGGLGRQLMTALLDEARGSAGVRLVQEAYNTASLSLYASLGFDVKEFLVQVQGKPRGFMPADLELRAYTSSDAEACAELCQSAYGFERRELRDVLERPVPAEFAPVVAIRDGQVTAYVSQRSVGLGAHGIAKTDEDIQALLLGLGERASEPISFLVPARRGNFLRWCLREGFRVVRPLTLMAIGDYTDPAGSYFPDILY